MTDEAQLRRRRGRHRAPGTDVPGQARESRAVLRCLRRLQRHPLERASGQVRGLPDVIAHGMFTMAEAGRVVTDWAGDPGAVVEYGVRFSAPVAGARRRHGHGARSEGRCRGEARRQPGRGRPRRTCRRQQGAGKGTCSRAARVSDLAEPPGDVVELAEQRAQARADRDFGAADRLRDEIAALGWVVADAAGGTFTLAEKPPYDVLASVRELPDNSSVADTHRATVSLVVDGWPDDVRTCIEALLAHTDADVVVQVLDLGNVDGAGDAVHEFAGPRLHEWHVMGGAGWSDARSALLKADTARIHVWCDLSTVFTGDALTPLLEAIESDEQVVAAGWRGVNVDVDDQWRSFVDAGPGRRRCAARLSVRHPPRRRRWPPAGRIRKRGSIATPTWSSPSCCGRRCPALGWSCRRRTAVPAGPPPRLPRQRPRVPRQGERAGPTSASCSDSAVAPTCSLPVDRRSVDQQWGLTGSESSLTMAG